MNHDVGSPRTLIMHGGMHKTGTSAIQKFLHEELDHPKFEYLTVGKVNSSLIVLECFHRRLAQLPHYPAEKFTNNDLVRLGENARKRFIRRMRETTKENVVLSAESFALLDRDECADFLDVVSESFSTVKLVLYVRPVRERIESAFQQKLKRRLVELDRRIKPNFKQRISEYDQIFGRENVTVRCFDRSAFAGGNVVNDFLETLGLPIHAKNASRANVGLSLPAVQLLYVYRQQFNVAIPEDTNLIQRLETLEGDSFRMHQDLLDRILMDRIERFTRIRIWLEKLGTTVGIDFRLKHGPLHRLFLRSNDNYRWLEKRTGISVVSPARDESSGVNTEEDLVSIPDDSLNWLQQQAEIDFQFVPQERPDSTVIAENLRKLALSI